MKRCLLHKTKLKEFIEWCEKNNIAIRDGKDQWQVLQVCTENFGWQVIFNILDSPEHYSINEKLIPTVKRFIYDKEREGANSSKLQ
jgi:hypothetical protein